MFADMVKADVLVDEVNIKAVYHHTYEFMQVFYHHIYEYQKGIRNLVLHTTNRRYSPKIMQRLEEEGISYLILPVGEDSINVFFGDGQCIEILKKIGKTSLSDFSKEEDFILGIMLGYSREEQFKRYLGKTTTSC
jgi:hypothetical protein